MPTLSILMASRNEQFLARTLQDVLAHSEADTEVIVVLDGPAFADEPLPDDKRLRVVEFAEPIGQRAAVNQAAGMSEADYVMKLDAHCAVGPGFDRILIEDMQGHADWTLVPKMFNLWAFDWVCRSCGLHRYQDAPNPCKKCGGPTEMAVTWIAKPNPETTAMRFDHDLRFGYWRDYKQRQYGDLVETMSLLGACWLMRRARFLELGGCDEAHGSWGQMGTEIACKTWLSGGSLICDKRTWFAHAFRTGKWTAPYPLLEQNVDQARAYSRWLWLGNHWPGASRPLSWLIEHFAPVPDWHDAEGRETLERVMAVGRQFQPGGSGTS